MGAMRVQDISRGTIQPGQQGRERGGVHMSGGDVLGEDVFGWGFWRDVRLGTDDRDVRSERWVHGGPGGGFVGGEGRMPGQAVLGPRRGRHLEWVHTVEHHVEMAVLRLPKNERILPENLPSRAAKRLGVFSHILW